MKDDFSPNLFLSDLPLETFPRGEAGVVTIIIKPSMNFLINLLVVSKVSGCRWSFIRMLCFCI